MKVSKRSEFSKRYIIKETPVPQPNNFMLLCCENVMLNNPKNV